MTTPKARLLLDVDGVLNAVPYLLLGTDGNDHRKLGDHWPTWKTGKAISNGRTFTINWAPEVAAFITDVHNAGVEVLWLSTWAHEANAQIGWLLGLPEFEVAGAPDYSRDGWWKLADAQRLFQRDGTPFVWIDDDFNFEREARYFVEYVNEKNKVALPIVPKTEHGITPEHITEVWEFLALHGVEKP